MKRGVVFFGLFSALMVASPSRGDGSPARWIDSNGREIVRINGFTFVEAAPGRPLVGAVLLILGKDKPGGNVQLFWSGGAPPYVATRNGTIALPNDPNGTSYDDPVLFDGLNETWKVD